MSKSNDASISLEGIGSISTCLKNALANVQRSPGKREGNRPKLGEADLLKNFESESVMDAFGEAVLDSQRGNTEKNLHASLVGSGEICYNRVGQNWRFIGREEFVLKEVQLSADVQTAKGKGNGRDGGKGEGMDIMTFPAQQTQILAYNDNR